MVGKMLAQKGIVFVMDKMRDFKIELGQWLYGDSAYSSGGEIPASTPRVIDALLIIGIGAWAYRVNAAMEKEGRMGADYTGIEKRDFANLCELQVMELVAIGLLI